MEQLATQPDAALALYVHLPWCIRRCPYCDFNAHALKGALPETAYLNALKTDLQQATEHTSFPPVVSIFFGGGTPSLFSPGAIQQILDWIDAIMPITSSCEITLEANPGTLETEKLSGFCQAGINRLSLGVQSFHQPSLQALGRIHTAETAYSACSTALSLDFNSVNIDLMFGLPQQTEATALKDLDRAIQTGCQHISWYELTIEPNTLFAHKPPQRPDADTRAHWTALGQKHLAAAGFNQYEVSAFCQPGFICQHNTWIWSFGDYLGIGAGAHSKLTNAKEHIRLVRYRHPTIYIDRPNKVEIQTCIKPHELPFEFLLNRLRIMQPIAWETAQTFAGITPSLQPIQQALKKGFMTTTSTHFQLTDKGRWFLDDVISLFLE